MSELFQKTVSSRARNTYTVLSFVVNQNAECGKEDMEVLLTQVGLFQKGIENNYINVCIFLSCLFDIDRVNLLTNY